MCMDLPNGNCLSVLFGGESFLKQSWQKCSRCSVRYWHVVTSYPCVKNVLLYGRTSGQRRICFQVVLLKLFKNVCGYVYYLLGRRASTVDWSTDLLSSCPGEKLGEVSTQETFRMQHLTGNEGFILVWMEDKTSGLISCLVEGW